MQVAPINYYNNFNSYNKNYSYNAYSERNRINYLVMQVGKNVSFPNKDRNWSYFNFPLVDKIVNYKEKAVPAVLNLLKVANDEKTIAEGLYIIDRMIENKVEGLKDSYHIISRFNCTQSPTLQVLLAGIYRKTQPPDAFGPLCKMLIRDVMKPNNNQYFDPSEEVGGAILDYLKNDSAKKLYPNVFKTN